MLKLFGQWLLSTLWGVVVWMDDPLDSIDIHRYTISIYIYIYIYIPYIHITPLLFMG